MCGGDFPLRVLVYFARDGVMLRILVFSIVFSLPLAVCQATSITSSGKPITSASISAPVVSQSLGSNIKEYFGLLIDQNKQRLAALTGLLKNFNQVLEKNNITYDTSSVIDLTIDDPVSKKDKLGIIFDFGDIGAGELNAFDGFTIKFALDALPPLFKAPFESFFAKALFDAEPMPSTGAVDALTGQPKQQQFRATPVMEFILKSAFLMRDLQAGYLDQSDVRTELMLLIFRLSQVPGIKSFDQVVKELPDSIEPLFKLANIGGMDGLAYMRTFWDRCMKIFNYNLQDTSKMFATTADAPDLVTALMAIGFKFIVEYERARIAFVKTPSGEKAWQEYLKGRNRETFNKSFPDYSALKIGIAKDCAALLMRVQKIRNAVIQVLRPLLEPLLTEYGLSFDLLIPPTKEEAAANAALQEGQDLALELEALMAADPLMSVDYEIIEDDYDDEEDEHTEESEPAEASESQTDVDQDKTTTDDTKKAIAF